MSSADVRSSGGVGVAPGGGGGGALSLLEYAASLPADARAALYASPWTCAAVFRALEPLAQQCVLRLLYAPDEGVPDACVRGWAKPDAAAAAAKHAAALAALERLSLRDCGGGGGRAAGPGAAWRLNPEFRAQLRSALSGGSGQLGGGAVAPAVAAVVPPREAVAAYAARAWEAVLAHLLDPARHAPPSLPVGLRGEPLDVAALVASAGLVADGALTAAGFRFLLLDARAQLWVVLREYVRSAEAASASRLASAMSFLMALGFMQVGRPYAMAALGPLEQRIAAHMAQLGLLYALKAEGGTYFCPTALAATLCSGGSGGGGAAADALGAAGLSGSGGGGGGGSGGGGYVIVETNFRVYAYTSSRVAVRVLEEFARLDCALPNLFVGTLTRDSVQRALARGVTAGDIVGFLSAHAHPQVAGRAPPVPETVQDQIRLWERETQRVALAAGHWYSNFEDRALYERARAFAEQRGFLLWDSDAKQQLVVSAAGHAAVKEHIRQLKTAREREGANVFV